MEYRTTYSKTEKCYFVSDFHLGAPNDKESKIREKKIIRWLDLIESDAKTIFFVGDIFDFWFEYKHVVPKGYIRFLGKISTLIDRGIEIVFFTGNHDMWMFDYFEKELNIPIYRKPIEALFNGKSFYIGHGDGLGPGDHGYKFIKKIFANSVCQWLFARIHPNLGIGVANYWSRKSRKVNGGNDEIFQGEENEWLVQFCKEELQKKQIDYFIFGHRHLPLQIDFKENKVSQYLNLGEWINHFTYGVFDGDKMSLEKYEE